MCATADTTLTRAAGASTRDNCGNHAWCPAKDRLCYSWRQSLLHCSSQWELWALRANTVGSRGWPHRSRAMAAAPSPPLTGGDPKSSVGDAAIFGVVTVSDRASAGVYADEGGPAILEFFAHAVRSPWQARYEVIPDTRPLIDDTLKRLVRSNASLQTRCCDVCPGDCYSRHRRSTALPLRPL